MVKDRLSRRGVGAATEFCGRVRLRRGPGSSRTGMDQWVEDILRFMQANRSWAGPVIFALAFAESMAFVSILVPFTAMIIGAGTLLCGGALDPWIVIPWGIAGAAAGDAV